MANGMQKAIMTGIERAAKSGLSKYYDVAICIQVELDKAGLKVVRKPRKDGLVPDPETFLFNCDCGFSINLFGSEVNPSVGVSCLSNTGNCHEAMSIDDRDREAWYKYTGEDDGRTAKALETGSFNAAFE
jgi:hypothetical protein